MSGYLWLAITVAVLVLVPQGDAHTREAKPAWLGNQEGKGDRLLPPWTPVQAHGSSVQVWGRSYDFEGPLPRQIETAGRKILTGPISLQAVSGGRRLQWDHLTQEVIESRDWRVTLHGSCRAGNLQMHGQTEVEFDGCMKVSLTLTPTGTVGLDSLTIEIPFHSANAKFVHFTDLTWSGAGAFALPEESTPWTSGFKPYVWVGDDERGLAWFTESQQGWQLAHPDQTLSIHRQSDQTTLRIRIIDTPTQLDKPLALVFGLQATPVRPVSAEDRYPHIVHGVSYSWLQPPMTDLDKTQHSGARYLVYHDGWTDYYGKMETPYGAQLKQLIAECHKRGIKLLLYVGYGLADSLPESQRYHDEMVVEPRIPWAPSDKNPDRSFDAACARGPFADYLTGKLAKLLDDYNIDGLYYDGTTEPWGCQNERHGCGYRDEQGHLHKTWPIFACRDLMKRIDTLFTQKRKTFFLNAHMSGSVTVPTLAFCNSYWDGEQFEDLKHGAKAPLEILNLGRFRAEFTGKPHGLGAEFLVYEGQPFTTQEALSFTLLHDVLVRPLGTGEMLNQIAAIWKALDNFDAADAEWIPYWSAHSPAQVTTPDALVSLYRAKGRGALMVVSNLGKSRAEVQVTLDLKRLDFAGKPAAEDALTGSPLALQDHRLTLSLDSMQARLIRITGVRGQGSGVRKSSD